MRKRISVACIGVFLLASCASGDSATSADDSHTVAPTEAPNTATTTTTSPPTTTATATVATTTIATTTTKSIGPWTTIPRVEMPTAVLTESAGGPLEIETMCVDVHTDGNAPASDTVEERLSEVLLMLGITIEDSNCDATLAFALSANRTSAEYTPGGTCYSGINAQGETALLLADQAHARWSIDINRPPPSAITTCPKRDDVILAAVWHEELVVPFNEMFGAQGDLAIYLSLRVGGLSLQDPPEEELRALIALVTQHRTGAVLRDFQLWCTEGDDYVCDLETYGSLVPYLIALLDTAEHQAQADSLLRIITRQDIGIRGRSQPEQWWEWWEGQS